MMVARTAVVLLSLAVCANAYSFLSCTDYDRASDVCYGFMRDYESCLPVMNHQYNFQSRAYNYTDATTMANNTASQADVSVDPTLQNRTSASAVIHNNQQVFNAYGRYQMLTAAPGQVLTLTWPRTAPPDGTAADDSEFVNVYYNPDATINAGTNYNTSTDPSLAVFMQHHIANLSYANNGACLVDDAPYNLSVHCSGQIQIPSNLTDGIYTFLWHWVINNTSPMPVDNEPLYLEYRFAFEINVRSPTRQACVVEAVNAAAPVPAPAPGPSMSALSGAPAPGPASIGRSGGSLESSTASSGRRRLKQQN